MNLYWYHSSNFGDCLAPYLFEKISGAKPIYTDPISGDPHYAIVGSLLEHVNEHTEVWGCGFVSDQGPVPRPAKIHAVRGALTFQRYSDYMIDCPTVTGDPALLLPQFYQPLTEKKYRVGIIPHVADLKAVLYRYANIYPDYVIIDLSEPVEKVIDQINSCECTISSSLHGLVVSHAYGIPSRWVEFSDQVIGKGFKFLDYFTTVRTEETPIDLREHKNLWNIQTHTHAGEVTVNLQKLIDSCPFKKSTITLN